MASFENWLFDMKHFQCTWFIGLCGTQDLANYEYDSMVVESLHILNQYYSGHDILFKRAKRANVRTYVVNSMWENAKRKNINYYTIIRNRCRANDKCSDTKAENLTETNARLQWI